MASAVARSIAPGLGPTHLDLRQLVLEGSNLGVLCHVTLEGLFHDRQDFGLGFCQAANKAIQSALYCLKRFSTWPVAGDRGAGAIDMRRGGPCCLKLLPDCAEVRGVGEESVVGVLSRREALGAGALQPHLGAPEVLLVRQVFLSGSCGTTTII